MRAFTFFGGVPRSVLYDNTKIVVARVLGDGRRQRTHVFSAQSHYLFEDRFGRPDKGNDKGKVECLVGFARRNFLVPIPVIESFEALNAHLLACCRRPMDERLRGHSETIGERLERDLAAIVHELLEARDEKRLLRLQRQLAAYKLLIVDELGYVPLSQTGAELLFEVFSQRSSAAARSSPATCPSTSGPACSAPSGSPVRCSIGSPTTSTSWR